MLDITEPSFARRVNLDDLPEAGFSYVLYGADIEEDRAATIVTELEARRTTASLYRIQAVDDAVCRIHGAQIDINLFESATLVDFAECLSGTVAVDLTSLKHRIWVPIISVLLDRSVEVVGLYAEPDDYQRSDDLPGSVYDLSTSRGIEPLPGFAKLGHRAGDPRHFAPLLGFEGARLGHIFDQEEVDAAATHPILGSPGFRLEYTTLTYLANRDYLEQARMDQRVELARASCPFEAYRAIERIHERTGAGYLRIAPIGTKPHALGAVLYAIRNRASVELIYDHPVRSTGRTRGSRGVYLYELSGFMRWLDACK